MMSFIKKYIIKGVGWGMSFEINNDIIKKKKARMDMKYPLTLLAKRVSSGERSATSKNTLIIHTYPNPLNINVNIIVFIVKSFVKLVTPKAYMKEKNKEKKTHTGNTSLLNLDRMYGTILTFVLPE